MPITATVVLSVPDLPDADIWFANSAAWSNYWNNISANIGIDAIVTTLYTPSNYDDTIPYASIIIDGVQYNLVTNDMFNSLLNKVNVLDAAFQDMRIQLRNAGLITNAQ